MARFAKASAREVLQNALPGRASIDQPCSAAHLGDCCISLPDVQKGDAVDGVDPHAERQPADQQAQEESPGPDDPAQERGCANRPDSG